MEPLDPAEVRRQTAALAAHLHRSGVAYLPAAGEGTDRFRQAMVTDASDESAAVADDPPKPAADSNANETSAGSTVATSDATSDQSSQTVKPTAAAADVEPGRPITADDYDGEPLPADQRESLLREQAAIVETCTRCSVLSECRTKTVYGEGNVTPRFVFFGEGPGADEDQSGRPFVGRAGQLLDKMIVACKLRREDVYILNSVKCRPPGNRNPQPEEIEHCRPYFETQLETLRSEYIVCLGAVAAQTLLQTQSTVGKLRGSLHAYRGSKVLVTYHPAYLLRNPKAKGAAWQDLQIMLADAGIKV